ncbi:hypothetical protein Tco_0475251 [Tanacetum coccineum]
MVTIISSSSSPRQPIRCIPPCHPHRCHGSPTIRAFGSWAAARGGFGLNINTSRGSVWLLTAPRRVLFGCETAEGCRVWATKQPDCNLARRKVCYKSHGVGGNNGAGNMSKCDSGAAKGTSSPSITKDPPLTSTNGNAHGKDDDVGSVLDGEVLANDNGPQEPILSDCNKSVNEEVVKVQEKGSLWSRLKEVKEASTSKPKSPMMYLEEESDEDKVFLPDDDMSKYISSTSRGFNLDEDNLDCYDGYEARVYDLPEQMQAFCDHYDIRINSRVSERMYT